MKLNQWECDECGEVHTLPHQSAHFEVNWGYIDGVEPVSEIDLCRNCVHKFFAEFPKVFEGVME